MAGEEKIMVGVKMEDWDELDRGTCWGLDWSGSAE
jgi:hypothetical protein